MTPDKLRMLKHYLYDPFEKQILEAFLLPINDLGLSPAEEKRYAMQAVDSATRINWESYNTRRTSFMELARSLLMIRAPKSMDEYLRKMYVRFMEGAIQCARILEQQERCRVPATEPREKDFHNTEMAAVFAHLPDQPEIREWLKEIDVSWDYDQLHMVTWFSWQLSLGSGKYSRSRPNHSAKVTYERLLNPFSLLWIAAALGVEKDLVLRTGVEIRDYATYREKCGVVRRAIPWNRIYELALPLVEKEK